MKGSWDLLEAEKSPRIRDLIRELLKQLGEDPDREGLQRTPERVERMLKTLTKGYTRDLDKIINGARFVERYDEMVLVRDIEFWSLCEHHALPFFGRAHVGYIPNHHILGLSKIPRVIDFFARRLQVQERLTCQIAEALEEKVEPKGVGVIVEAQHLCMIMRGVQKQNAKMITSSMLGCFRTDARTRGEFLSLVRARREDD